MSIILHCIVVVTSSINPSLSVQGVINSVDHGDAYPALKKQALAVLQNLSGRASCLSLMASKIGGEH